MAVDCSADLFEALEMVALVHRQDGRFVLSGGIPRWFRKLCPGILLIESCGYQYSEKEALIQTGRLLALDLHPHQRKERFARDIREALEAQVRQRARLLLQTNARPKAEIAERESAEHSMRESERRFRTLFDNLFDAQLLMEADGCIRDVNRAACRLLSCSREQLCGRAVADLFAEHESGKILGVFPMPPETASPILMNPSCAATISPLFPSGGAASGWKWTDAAM